MKKNVSILLIVSCILIIFTSILFAEEIKFTFQNEPDGFRGLKWGDTPTEDMVFFGQNVDKEDLYHKANDKMEIRGVKLSNITYRFYKKKEFIGASGEIMSDDDYSILEIFCREEFGKPSKDSFSSITGDGELEWCGEKSRISLLYYPVEGFFTGVLSFSKGEKLKEEEGEDEISEAKKNFDFWNEQALIENFGEQEGVGKKKPIILFGTGQEASEKFVLEEGLVRFNFLYKGQHNFVVWLLDNTGKKLELLINKIGYFDGSKAIRIDKTGIYLLDISADEYWLVTIFSG